MKNLVLPILFISLLTACSSDSENTDDSQKPTDGIPSEQETQIEEESAIDSVWIYYAGTVGIYNSPIVMVLSFNGSDVTGSYWYAKHKKQIHLNGEYDSKFKRTLRTY
ncbi:MAG: hypothetical protein HRT57_04405 [Crocinitomicaceae bacterium]|nr:hypothetical protein [Crocinitomicaceae bacterium]